MKVFSCSLLLLSGILAAQSENGGLRATSTAPSLHCHIALVVISTSQEVGSSQLRRSHHHHECSPVENGEVSDFSYTIELPSDFVQKNYNDLVAGILFANVPNGELVNGTVIYPTQSVITVESAPESFHARRRRLDDAIVGTRSLLVIRISTNDATPDFTAQQYYDYIFDTSQPLTKPTLKSQYSALSFGKLNFVPAQGGVVDVHLNMNAIVANFGNIRDGATAAVQTQYGVSTITSLADHVMYCFPPGTGDWAGSSAIVSWRMILNNQWCGFLSGTMHEMGHNLGLQHSNLPGMEYSDFTSYMSAGYANTYYPLKSFNGANNWQFGWYSDRMMVIDPSSGGRKVTLGTFVDYQKSNKINPVLIMVGTDTFLQYNRAKGMNSETPNSINQVTVVRQMNNGTLFLGGIDTTSRTLTISNFGGSGRNLVIYACSSGAGSASDPDWMAVSIGFDKSYCTLAAAQLLPPTSVPVKVPSGMCFSGANTVEVEARGLVSMKELRIGDMVKSADGKYTKVYSFGHYHATLKADFLQIYAQGLSKPIEITKDHMLFVGGVAVPASTVSIGDMLDLGAGTKGAAYVKQIKAVTRFGVYAPFTVSGTIEVSGVAASSYVTLQAGSNLLAVGGSKTPLSMHWLAHIFQSPHRLICSIVNQYCNTETYTEEGISKWVEGPLYWSERLLKQNYILLIGCLCLAIPLAVALHLVELAMPCVIPGFFLLMVTALVFVSPVQPRRK